MSVFQTVFGKLKPSAPGNKIADLSDIAETATAKIMTADERLAIPAVPNEFQNGALANAGEDVTWYLPANVSLQTTTDPVFTSRNITTVLEFSPATGLPARQSYVQDMGEDVAGRYFVAALLAYSADGVTWPNSPSVLGCANTIGTGLIAATNPAGSFTAIDANHRIYYVIGQFAATAGQRYVFWGFYAASGSASAVVLRVSGFALATSRRAIASTDQLRYPDWTQTGYAKHTQARTVSIDTRLTTAETNLATTSAIASAAGDIATATQSSLSVGSIQHLFRVGDPVSSASVASAFNYISNDPVLADAISCDFSIFAHQAGTFTMQRLALSGGNFVPIGSLVTVSVDAGKKTYTPAFFPKAGEYVSISGANIIIYTSGQSAGGSGWMQYNSGSTPPSAPFPKPTSVVTTPRLELSFDFTSNQQVVTADRFLDTEAKADSGGSSLQGKRIGFLGDSISTETIYGAVWRAAFAARSGAMIAKVDARPGRTFAAALEGYGASAPLASTASLTGYSGAISTTGGQLPQSGTLASYNTAYNAADGTTLAQWLADLDMLIVWLGTNDAHWGYAGSGIGAITDAYTAGTMHAAMNFAFDAIMASAPGLRVVVVTPYQTQAWYSYANGRAYADAIIAQADQRGFPVLDAYKKFGINGLNYATRLTDDGTGYRIHPLPATSQKIVGPAVAEFARQFA